MKAEIINPFYLAAKEILEMETGLKGVRGELSLASSKWTTQEITVIINIIGDVKGTFLIGLGESVGLKLAGALMGTEEKTISEMVVSAIAETANIIAGRSLAKLEMIGYIADITPPMFLYGKSAYISTLDRQRIQIPLNTEFGTIELSIALEEKVKR